MGQITLLGEFLKKDSKVVKEVIFRKNKNRVVGHISTEDHMFTVFQFKKPTRQFIQDILEIAPARKVRLYGDFNYSDCMGFGINFGENFVLVDCPVLEVDKASVLLCHARRREEWSLYYRD